MKRLPTILSILCAVAVSLMVADTASAAAAGSRGQAATVRRDVRPSQPVVQPNQPVLRLSQPVVLPNLPVVRVSLLTAAPVKAG